ncbi:MFS transporter [Arthrobacter sp. JSM 101049]|uniref:MFS transporter n=1 Tax=Arthrobacter sp. JSM 101049 TaxID=929097 RepID=UPI00356549D0
MDPLPNDPAAPASAPPAAPPKAQRPPALWRNRDYRWWLSTDTSTGLGRALHNFAVPLLALYVTGDPAQAGIVAAIGQVGRLVATLPGGVLADRHDRRRLILLGTASGVLVATALAAFQYTGLLGFWLLTALNLLMNVRSGLFDGVPNAALKAVVEPRSLGSAMSANQGRDAVVSLAGGPVGGVLLVIGHAVPFAATALLNVFGLLSVLRVRADLRPRRDAADAAGATGPGGAGKPAGHDGGTSTTRAGYLREAWEGFAWLLHRPELRGVMAISTIVNLGMNAAVTSVVFGLQQRGESPATIGVATACVGVGMLAGAVLAPPLVRRVPTGWLGAVGLAACSGAVAVLPFVHTVPAICVVLGASMFAAPAINASLLGYFTVAVPTHLLGRANSALDLLAMGAVPLAPLVAGFGYAAWGWTGVLALCAGICGIAVVLAFCTRRLLAIPASDRWEDHAAANAREAALRR